MDAVDRYHYTLRQEVLKECSCDVMNSLITFMCKHNIESDDETTFRGLFYDLSHFKNNIVSDYNDNDIILDGFSEQLKVFRTRVAVITALHDELGRAPTWEELCAEHEKLLRKNGHS